MDAQPAEITLEKGCKYFIITDANNNRNESGNNSTDTSVFSFRGTNYEAPGNCSNAVGADRKSEMTILLFNEKPDNVLYDAEMMRRAIRNEYKIEDDLA